MTTYDPHHTITTDVGNCARCKQDHQDLTFDPLSHPTDWTHWSPCPTNGEPIMLQIVEKGGNDE